MDAYFDIGRWRSTSCGPARAGSASMTIAWRTDEITTPRTNYS